MVAESVVVIKKLLQTQPGSHVGEVVGRMARLVNRIAVPQARAAILWLLGEHCDKKGVSILAPDVLRMMAKSFANEVWKRFFYFPFHYELMVIICIFSKT